MSAIGRFNSQLSHLSKIPFESLSPLPGETHVTSFGSQQVQSRVQSYTYLILTEYEVNTSIGNKSRVKDRGEAEVFYEVFISYTDQVRSVCVCVHGVWCARVCLCVRACV